jgi:putative oxidoreductase
MEVTHMRVIYPPFYSGRLGVALLVVRFVVGLAFIQHGLPKVQDVGAFATQMHLPFWLATIAAWVEVVGGALLLLGLLTPLAAFFLTLQMLGALFTVHLPAGHPFVKVPGPSYELAAVYLCVSLAYLLAGPGAYSVDALLMRERTSEPTVAPLRERGIT